jgi:hypothetical protein
MRNGVLGETAKRRIGGLACWRCRRVGERVTRGRALGGAKRWIDFSLG